MASDVGVLKIGISANPKTRLTQARADRKFIKRVSHAWGMSRSEAIVIEEAAHQRFLLVALGNEMFRLKPDTAASAIEGILAENGIVPVSLDLLSPRREPSETKTANILIRAAPSLKEQAERIARKERRSLSAWIEGLIVDKVAEVGAEPPEPPARRKQSREPVTAGSSR